jgi:hypothetical protein
LLYIPSLLMDNYDVNLDPWGGIFFLLLGE